MMLRYLHRARLLVLVMTVLLATLPARGGAHAAPGAADFAAIDAYVQQQVRDAGVPGVTLGIVHGDAIVHLRGFGSVDGGTHPATPQTPFVIGSVSKSFTALAIMQLSEGGKIDLDTPARRYLPWFRLADVTASDRITVRQLLNQTSGIPTEAGLTPLREPAQTLEAQVRALAGVRPISAPGTTFTYSNANYEVLGLIVQTVSGQPYASYVQHHIFAPLAMTHSYTTDDAARRDGLGTASTFFFGMRRDRRPFYRPDFLPAGFLISSAEDMAHYLVAQMNGGRYGGRVILSPAGIATLHRPAVQQPAPGGQAFYAMGWVVSTVNGIPLIWHNGSSTDMHAMIVIEPQGRWGVVMLYNATGTLYEVSQKLDTITVGVASMVAGREPQGTLRGLYIGFDLLVVLVTASQLRALIRLVRGRSTPRRPRPRFLAWLRHPVLGWFWFGYSKVLVPAAILVAVPRFLSAPWTSLARTDLGLWLLVFALLQLVRGALWLGRELHLGPLGRRSMQSSFNPAT